MLYALYALSLFLILAFVLIFFHHRFWWVKIVNAMLLQLVVASLLTIIGMLLFLDPTPVLITTILILAGLAIYRIPALFPYTPLAKKEVEDAHQSDLLIKCMTANVRMSNSDYKRLVQSVEQEKPDILLLTEVNQEWLNEIKAIDPIYPHTIKVPLENTYGIALYSKWPFREQEVNYLEEEDVPSIHAIIEGPKEQAFHFIGLHPKPPAPWNIASKKDIELLKAASRVNRNLLPSIVSGDLNDVAWSRVTMQFKAVSGMLDPRAGRGFFSTYNVFVPLFRMPIDHFFVSDHFSLKNMERMKAIGSDHFPVKITLGILKKRD